jgi:protein SCO1/2
MKMVIKKSRASILLAGVGLLLALFAMPGFSANPSDVEEKPENYADDETIGIEEKLGAQVPMDLKFLNERGLPVTFSELIDKPTVLLLVYFRCPSICSPLMHEVADMVEMMDLEVGLDYDLITVSFDYRETPELAKTAKKNLIDGIEKKIPRENWHFLTGAAPEISALTDGVGFRFRMEKQDYLHAGTVIFLSNEGKIMRYLDGLKLLPADMKLAVIDAAEGKPRSFMQKIQSICFAFDPEGKTYVLKLNRIILFGTLFLLGVFLLYLLVKGKRKTKEA